MINTLINRHFRAWNKEPQVKD